MTRAYPSDDPTPLFTPPTVAGAVELAQATLVEWDPATLDNTVRYRGGNLHDLHVLASARDDLGAGDEVLIAKWRPGGPGRTAVYTILGRSLAQPDLPPEVE